MGLQERQKIKELTEVTLPEREREIVEICGAAVKYEVDWTSLADDLEGLRFIDNISCHRLNMALRTIALQDLGKEALQDGLKLVKLKNVKTPAEMKMDFAGGVLEMHCVYALGAGGMHNDMEIYRLLLKGL